MCDDIMDCDDTFSDDKRPLACGERSGRRVSLASPDLCVEISVSSLCNPGRAGQGETGHRHPACRPSLNPR